MLEIEKQQSKIVQGVEEFQRLEMGLKTSQTLKDEEKKEFVNSSEIEMPSTKLICPWDPKQKDSKLSHTIKLKQLVSLKLKED